MELDLDNALASLGVQRRGAVLVAGHARLSDHVFRPAHSIASARELSAILSEDAEPPSNVLAICQSDGLAFIVEAGDGLEGLDAVLIGPESKVEDLPLKCLLFDSGFVLARAWQVGGHGAGLELFVRSSFVSDPFELLLIADDSNVVVEMTNLGRNGRFANQLFQFAFLYFYGLRTGSRIAYPRRWRGLEALSIPRGWGTHGLPIVSLKDGNRDPLRLWQVAEPPVDNGFTGYFQALPDAIRNHHRHLFRSLFRLSPECSAAFEAWMSEIMKDGRRRLVCAHVRRGDYAPYDGRKHLFARVPVDWYVEALGQHLADGDVLHIVSDDEDERRFIHGALGRPVLQRPDRIPEHISDFFALVGADVAFYCNSSFSLGAALLASEGQQAYLVDFDKAGFVPFTAWECTDFHDRFQAISGPGIDVCELPELLAEADRAWRSKYPLRFRAQTTLPYVLTLASVVVNSLLQRHPASPRVADLRARYDKVTAYWEALQRGETAFDQRAHRFFKRR